MCRLAAFPPGFARADALEILEDMEGANRDGVGYAYVNAKGRFEGERYPGSLTSLLQQPALKKRFLAHMPCDGWTIAHLRWGTHGANTRENTHPFTAGEWCVVHNGVWSGHGHVRSELHRSVKFRGETDSEVAAHLLNVLGPRKFLDRIGWGGVFLALNRDRSLWLIKGCGGVKRITYKGVTLIASSLPQEPKMAQGYFDGWYHYSPKGILKSKRENKVEVLFEQDEAPDEADRLAEHLRFGARVIEPNPDPAPDDPGESELRYRKRQGWKWTPEDGWRRDPDFRGDASDAAANRKIDAGELGWWCDEHGHWHKPPPKLEDKPIIVPRDWDTMSEDEWKKNKLQQERHGRTAHDDFPRHPPLPKITQSKLP